VNRKVVGMTKSLSFTRGLAVVNATCIACIGAILVGEGKALGWVIMFVGLASTFTFSNAPPLSDQFPSSLYRKTFILGNVGAIGCAMLIFFAKTLG